MKRRKRGSRLCGLAVALLIVAVPCLEQGFNDGVTADEGVRYSLPAMEASGRYTAGQLNEARASFQKLA